MLFSSTFHGKIPIKCKYIICFISVLFMVSYYHYSRFGIKENTSLNFHYETPLERFHDKCVNLAMKNPEIKCPWPPGNLRYLINLPDGRFDLTINPIVKEKVNSYQKQLYEEIENTNLLPNRANIENISQYDMYPQFVNISFIVESIIRGNSVSEEPLNDIPVKVLRNPKYECNCKDVGTACDLMVFVKTCATCFRNRMRARRTYARDKIWGSFKIKFVFVTGLPEEVPDAAYYFTGLKLPKYVPQESTNTESRFAAVSLFEESSTYGDLLIGAFADTYYNLTKKMILTFRWAAAFCNQRHSMYMFIDDDELLIPRNVVNFFRNDQIRLHPLYAGGEKMTSPVIRPSINLSSTRKRWAVSKAEIAWDNYPPYLRGNAYILGHKAVKIISIAMAYTKEFRIDDVYLGIVMYKLRIHINDLPDYVRFNWVNPDLNKVLVIRTSAADNVNWNTGIPITQKKNIDIMQIR